MRLGYGYLSTKFSVLGKRLIMVAGLLILPITVKLERSAAAKPTPAPANVPPQPIIPDPRAARLRRFFSSQHCPVLAFAEDFVQAADDNHLDWRLLPSISLIESGGGRAFRNNNIFGWNNGNQPFPTIRAGLNTVAFKLGKSTLYRNRNSVEKLRLYNPQDDSYVGRVLTVMNRISPVAELNPIQHLIRRQNEYVYVSN